MLVLRKQGGSSDECNPMPRQDQSDWEHVCSQDPTQRARHLARHSRSCPSGAMASFRSCLNSFKDINRELERQGRSDAETPLKKVGNI